MGDSFCLCRKHGSFDRAVRFIETELSGAWIIESQRLTDPRGFFARTWCSEEFTTRGLAGTIAQTSISFNHRRGTIRGLHYQVQPYKEAKVVRCIFGAAFDVIVDLRRDSSTFGRWQAVELTASNDRALYLPEGFGHGFQTLEDNTELLYYTFEFYHPECARGVIWSDATLGIRWPVESPIVSERDQALPTLALAELP